MLYSHYIAKFCADDFVPPENIKDLNSLVDLSIKRERYATSIPFSVGREQNTNEDSSTVGISDWLYLSSMKISRHHATVRWDVGQQKYVIDSLSKNGVDVNTVHIPNTTSAPLEPRTLVRVGPCYLFFLLPHSPETLSTLPTTHFTPSSALASYAVQKSAALALPAKHTTPSSTPSSTTRKEPQNRVSQPYRVIIDRVYQDHIQPAHRGYFTATMIVHYAPVVFPEEQFPQDKDYFRKALQRALTKVDSSYAQVSAEMVPGEVLESAAQINPRRIVNWYRLKPEEVSGVASGVASGASLSEL